MKLEAFVVAAALGLSGGTAQASCGYFGCGYNTASFQFGVAFGQLSPYYQRNFGWYDGSNLVAMRNRIYDDLFGINSVPGGFPATLNMFDNQIVNVLPTADPRNFYPPVFSQITSMQVCIPGILTPGIGC